MKNPILITASWLAGRLPQPVLKSVYRFPPLARLIRRTLNRAAPEGLTSIAVAGGLLKGCFLEIDLQTEKDLWLGTYEPDLQGALATFVNPGAIVYDVGANIGYVSMMCAKCAGPEGKVFAFEPLPDNQQRFMRTLALNQLQDRVVLVNKAVGRSTGSTTFWVHASTSMGRLDSVMPENGQFQRSIDIEIVSLDDYIYTQGHPVPDVIKLDIEGGEVDALPGMQRLLKEGRPLLLVEVHGTEAGKVVWQELKEAGYKLYWMRKGYPAVNDSEALQGKTYVVGQPQEAV
ncbi:MAG: FkbM family methyltransferase [Anaerolineales bacterium]|nr:FkbM family methyltransferase [Anaerolineales bacterium]